MLLFLWFFWPEGRPGSSDVSSVRISRLLFCLVLLLFFFFTFFSGSAPVSFLLSRNVFKFCLQRQAFLYCPCFYCFFSGWKIRWSVVSVACYLLALVLAIYVTAHEKTRHVAKHAFKQRPRMVTQFKMICSEITHIWGYAGLFLRKSNINIQLAPSHSLKQFICDFSQAIRTKNTQNG